MTFTPDISTRIQTDFSENAAEAAKRLRNAILQTDYLRTPRVIRCIVFLAKGNLAELDRFIETAVYDPRDVMLWAEYEGAYANGNLRRVRDFNNSFDAAHLVRDY
ncbi:MAG TPA: hypothetical protein VK183_10640 [Flavobacterium sp.]|nr:hypothetical protein [Flavobacterium sp.]